VKLTPGKTFAAGALLILLANAVALGGVYLNRHGEVDSRLTLSQRELGVGSWRGDALESSEMSLRLGWRVGAGGTADENLGVAFGAMGGTPEWLDAAHMAALGFDVAVPEEGNAWRRVERALPRQVLLVLELAGPAWQRELERARQNAARHEAARAVNADSKEFVEKAKRAQERLRNEETLNSRLFVIDAGLDHAALRARYPDRGRYLIQQGTVRPYLAGDGNNRRVAGRINGLAIAQINVPHALRAPLQQALNQQQGRVDGSTPRFEATLAVGQRFEPWLEAVTVTP
jgi:hypothetical protein